MKTIKTTLSFALALALFAASANAEKADRTKPMNVESDNLRYDDLHQSSVFTGKVLVTKGTIVIRGTKMEVHQDAEGYQFGTVWAEPGKRAFFRQKREGADEFIEGESDIIEYDGKADLVKFIGRAEMRRLRGTTVNDETSGSIITYDNNSDQFAVAGGSPGGAAPFNPGGRVRATLAPRAVAAAPAASAASAPRAPASAAAAAAAPASAASAARLRSTTTLAPESR